MERQKARRKYPSSEGLKFKRIHTLRERRRKKGCGKKLLLSLNVVREVWDLLGMGYGNAWVLSRLKL